MAFRNSILITGLVLMLLPVFLPAPGGLPERGWLALGLALAMALFWLTEAMPLAATALLPLAFAPLVGISDFATVASSFSHPLVILFLGGFLLARAIEKSGLHRRLAFALLSHAGTSPRRVLAATMIATAFLSLWISNTASAMVVAPIATAIAASQDRNPPFGTALMLGVAFSATIGGMGSLIGTPPNALFAAEVGARYGIEVGFAHWAMVGVPVSTLLLLFAWLVLSRMSPGLPEYNLTRRFGDDMPPMRLSERRVAIVAALTALAWILRPLIEWAFPSLMLTDAGIAMMAAVLLFVLRGDAGEPLLDWETAATLRWDVLILFGGGLALAGILDATGVTGWVGSLILALENLPEILLLLLLAALIVFLGELASNTAMAAIFLPIAGAMAISLNLDPIIFMLPVALAASIGFMLPVATPPNAIVFGNPSITRADMLRAGAPLDIIGIVITVGASSLLGPFIFG